MQKARMFILVLVYLVVAFMTMTPVFAKSTWISFDGGTVEKKPSAVVHQSNNLETVVEFQTKGVIVDEIVENGEAFQTLRFPHYYTTLEVGKPQLPAITEMIGIPGSANVRMSVVDSTVVTLTGYKVYPFQTPLFIGEKRVGFDIDREFYSQNLFYPEEVVEVSDPGIWRDIRVVTLRVYPIQYNPATGELKVYQKLTVKLEYFGTSKVNVLTPRERPIQPVYDKMYRSCILNYDFLNLYRGKGGARQDYDYLIITVDQFEDELDTLVIHKDNMGLDTEIHLLSNIGSTTTEIKDHIAQEYNDHNIRYVLLAGDIDELPIFEGGTGISDYWYACLVGGDLLPEIAVGRFSTIYEDTMENMVNKTINFEFNLFQFQLWQDKALLVAHKEEAPGKFQGCKEDIREAVDTKSGTYKYKHPEFDTAYGANPFFGGNNSYVIAAINDGRGVVNYFGHGGTTSWSGWTYLDSSFTNNHVAALMNEDKTPVVFSIACNNNRLDADVKCLGEAFTQSSQGAVAFLGATRPALLYPAYTHDKQLFAAIFDEGNINIGNASNIAAIRMMKEHGGWGMNNAMVFLWLGDPSLICTEPLPEPCLTYTPESFATPYLHVPNDGYVTDTIVVRNTGAEQLNGNISSCSSWISLSLDSFSIDSCGPPETVELTIDVSGYFETFLVDTIHITSNDTSHPHAYVGVHVLVSDEYYPPEWVASTNETFILNESNVGNLGHQTDTAGMYLIVEEWGPIFDGSVALATASSPARVGRFIYTDEYYMLAETSYVEKEAAGIMLKVVKSKFSPLNPIPPDYDWWWTTVEEYDKIFYSGAPDSAERFIKKVHLKIYKNAPPVWWGNDPSTTNPLMYVGTAMDFNLPSDTGYAWNIPGIDEDLNLLYQQGRGPENELLYAGIAFVEFDEMENRIPAYAGHILSNWAYVYPQGGYDDDSLYRVMSTPGWAIYDTSGEVVGPPDSTDWSCVITGKQIPAGYLDGDTVEIEFLIVVSSTGLQELKDRVKMFVCGNADRDRSGAIGFADVISMADECLGGSSRTFGFLADINGDCALDFADVVDLAYYCLGVDITLTCACEEDWP